MEFSLAQRQRQRRRQRQHRVRGKHAGDLNPTRQQAPNCHPSTEDAAAYDQTSWRPSKVSLVVRANIVMVGVPRSKGCSLCVKRRVKCDQAHPGKPILRTPAHLSPS